MNLLKYIKEDDPIPEKYMYVLDKCKDKLSISILDIENQSQSNQIIIMPNEPSQLSAAIAIQLPNSELFCISNQNLFRPQYISIINMNNLSIKSFLKQLQRNKCGIIYYQNFVYLFGGNDIFDVNFIQITEKFDLIQNKWTNLSPLPIGSADCDCVAFKNKILITGWNLKKIYEYDILLDSFSELDLTIREFYIKILISWKSYVYIIENCGNIYESGYENQYAWALIGDFGEELYTPAHKVYSEDSVFVGFVYDRYENSKSFTKYYRFDFKKIKCGNGDWVSKIN